MYRIELPKKGEEIAYAQTYATKLIPLINEYLKGKVLDVAVKNRGTVHVAVGVDSLTRRFLEKLSKVTSLEKYLLMKPSKQKSLIKQFEKDKYSNELVFKRITPRKCDNYGMLDQDNFDHFNEIMYDIFVNGVYDEKETFNKRDFVVKSELRYCPYCGIELIEPTARTKKQIDHFFPKREFPFLALCYYNLIPCCDKCNESPNKGAKNPLEKVKDGKKIMHPYSFVENKIRFHLNFLGTDIYEDHNFQLKVGFSNVKERDGYDYFFDMINRYENLNIEAAKEYRTFLNIKALPFYSNLGIINFRQKVLAYGKGSDKPQYQQCYKMQNDIFNQLANNQIVGDYYTKESGSNTEKF